MNKKEIVKKLIEKGIIPTPENIKKFSEKFAHTSNINNEKIIASVKQVTEKKILSTEDFVNFYRSRYEKIRKILLKKMDDVSINKIKNVFSEISVIGIVVEKNPNGFIVEDLTGQIEVVSKADVSEDDVIGIKGIVREGKIFANNVIYPDVSFNRKIGKMQSNVLMIKNIHGCIKENFDIIITPNEYTGKNIVHVLSNPAFVKVRKKDEKVNILVYQPNENEDVISLLKKRYFPVERNQIKWDSDPFVIEEIPDVFWVISSNNEVKLYKGILIVFSESAIVDLETKKVNFNVS